MKNQSDPQVGGQMAIQAEAGDRSVVRRWSFVVTPAPTGVYRQRGSSMRLLHIPGILMAGAKLLDEHSHPDLDQIQVALSEHLSLHWLP